MDEWLNDWKLFINVIDMLLVCSNAIWSDGHFCGFYELELKARKAKQKRRVFFGYSAKVLKKFVLDNWIKVHL